MKNLYIIGGSVLLGAFIFVVFFTLFSVSFAGQTYSSNTGPQDTYINHDFFIATSTTATSTTALNLADRILRISGAKKVTFFFARGDTRGSGNSGSTNFRVQVSRDGSNWVYFNKLIQNVATSTDVTVLSSVTLTGTSTAIESLDIEHDAFLFARCIAVETTDGEHTCQASVQF